MIYIIILVLILLGVGALGASKLSKLIRFKTNMRKIIFVAICSIIIALLIPVVSVATYLYYPNNSFNSKKWNSKIHVRYKMSEDIIQRNLLIGKTKEEVVELLGKKEVYIKNNLMEYYLGHVPGLFNIDPDILCIKFKENRVVDVFQYTS